MAQKKQRNPNDGEESERKIPVFTVIKNGSILKNIFLIDKPPLSQSISKRRSITSFEDEGNTEDEVEILNVGRHPDCHIMLTHPSISRFHLQIHTTSSSQKLSVTDLSSGNFFSFLLFGLKLVFLVLGSPKVLKFRFLFLRLRILLDFHY